MLEPVFLTLEDVLEIHDDQIARYGGAAGVRDHGLLMSAIATPSATWESEFLHPELPEMAAAYLFHLVRDHPFFDGNKRVGTMAAYTFLVLNGLELVADDDSLENLVLGCAKGHVSKGEITAFIRLHVTPTEPE